jgi:hypothetical protein
MLMKPLTLLSAILFYLTSQAGPRRGSEPAAANRLKGCISKFCFRCSVLILLMLAFAATSQGEILPLKKYTTSDGLAQDRVGRIVRDSRGFLWFCTGEGLSRFDGYQFKNGLYSPGT